MGYLKLNFASQSLRLSSSILPRPYMHTHFSYVWANWRMRMSLPVCMTAYMFRLDC